MYNHFGTSTHDLWYTYLSGSSDNPPAHRYFTDGDEIVEGWGLAPGFRNSVSVDATNLRSLQVKAANDISSMFLDGELTCQDIPMQGRQIPLHSLPTVRERNLLELQTNYNNPIEIPGNIAGGIGKGNGKGGAAGQVHDDRRQLTGSVVVQRHGPDTVNLHFDVRMHIDDTIDFIPGNLAGIERLITAQLMLLEAYDWAYDVPFTVSYQDREHFPDYVLSLDNQNGTCDDPDPLDPPTSEAGGSGSTTTVNSWDPNEKVSIGIGAEGYVPDGQALLYTIYFENLSSATAPAQEVFITDQLDDRLDWSTLEVLAFGFNNTQVDMQDHPHLSAITTTVSTDPNPVRVQTDLDPETGMFQWTARSEDAVTGELPEDPLAGFLPPNDDQHSGEGFVTFRIEPLDSWVDAEPMTNEARIVFDTNEPIDTNTVTNTLDTMSPTSRVQSLPAETQGNTVSVHWSGSDAGSGIATYDVFVSEDGGPFTQWLTDTVTTSAVFTGSLEHTYSFYSGAVDRVGNRQSVVPEAQATTKLIQQQQMIYLPLVRR
jgi:hypothetical protein